MDKHTPLAQILANQGNYFANGHTRPIAFRKRQLIKLKQVIEKYREDILTALEKDLRKPAFEAYGAEVGFVLDEISFAIKNINRWSKRKRARFPLMWNFGENFIYPQPYGHVLIMAPWNYPFQLLMSPLIGALAAGNVVTLKPSELAPHTSRLVTEILHENFPSELLFVAEGGAEVAQKLLQEKFDHILFTGSQRVGKIVLQKAAETLTPVTLELGGKSPVIVDETARLEVAARRIVWGKFLNAGQTCVAPDYLLVQNKVKDRFVHLLKQNIVKFYGEFHRHSRDYGRIVNKSHYGRLTSYLAQGTVAFGGQTKEDQLFIGPTLMLNTPLDQPIMREEIFGPILPIVGFDKVREALGVIEKNPKPLALYLFTSKSALKDLVIDTVAFGGGCINDTLLHVGMLDLPFGGIGPSGMGRYRGKASFDCFSHLKSITTRESWFDPSLRYPPYNHKLDWLKKLMG